MNCLSILVCLDSWKGSLSALEACQSVSTGLRAALPDADCILCPMADGGEGTLELIALSRPGTLVSCEVTGPLEGRRMRAAYLWWETERRALMEMARCAGLPLLKDSERDPLRTTTRGVGEWLSDAFQKGVQEVVLALGGSATVDGGTGMARALGWRFLDGKGSELAEGGGSLKHLARVVPPAAGLNPGCVVRVMCDVTNPLLGPKGAAAVFGPQKGADAEAVAILEEGLGRLAERLERDVGVKGLDALPGGGAAGGMAAGAVAFLQGELVSGVHEVMHLSRLQDRMREADLVVTGEGRLDHQSLDGKVVSGVMELARAEHIPVAVVTGSSLLTESEWRAGGLVAVEEANRERLPVEEAMQQAAGLAEQAAKRLGVRYQTTQA